MQERQRVDRLVVRARPVARPAHDPVLRDHGVDLDRPRVVRVHAHRVPPPGAALHLVRVEQEHAEVGVVSVEVRAGGLGQVPVGVAAGGGEGAGLAHLPALGDALRAGGLGIPEVAAGLGIGVGRRADQGLGVHPAQQRLDLRVAMRAEGEAGHRHQVHHEDDGRGRAAVAGDRLGRHQHGGVAGRPAAVLARGRSSPAAATGPSRRRSPAGRRRCGHTRSPAAGSRRGRRR